MSPLKLVDKLLKVIIIHAFFVISVPTFKIKIIKMNAKANYQIKLVTYRV